MSESSLMLNVLSFAIATIKNDDESWHVVVVPGRSASYDADNKKRKSICKDVDHRLL